MTAFRDYLSPSSNFSDAGSATVAAVAVSVGAESPEAESVRAAWSAVYGPC